MKKYLSLFFLALAVSCVSKNNKVESLTIPVIVDTVGIQIEPYYEQFPSSISYYPPIFIGIQTDSVFICQPFGPLPNPSKWNLADLRPSCLTLNEDYYLDSEKSNFTNFKEAEYADLQIYVDTTQLYLDTYLTIIKNNGLDTAIVGNDLSVTLVMESLSEEKVWKPVQEDFTFKCGNGVSSLILPPSNIILTFTPRFRGSYMTKLRLKLGKNYSNEFGGCIVY